jgi:hypothetical protein
MRRWVIPSALVAGLLTGAIPTGHALAGAASTPLVQRLISTSQASKLGFGRVVNAATSSHKTGAKNCHTAAEVVFIEKRHIVGLIDEVFSCNSAKDARAVIADYEKHYTPSTALAPPAALGTTAVGSIASAPVYAFFWTTGSYVGFVAVDTDATANKVQYEKNLRNPLTRALTATLEKAALEQDAHLR